MPLKAIPTEFAHHLKLWFLAILTATARRAKRSAQALDLPEVDQFLAQTATDAGVKVIGLETPQEQLDAIATMRPEVAATLLTVAAREPGMNDDVYATMLRLYRESRPAEILPIADAVGGIERGRARGAGRIHARSAAWTATPSWPSAPRRSWPPAAPSSPSARCIFRARTASSNASARGLQGHQGLVRLPIPRRASRCS